MDKDAKIYVAGHRGLVGAAIVRQLNERGFTNLRTRSSAELDLRRQAETEAFFESERPEYVFLAAAKVGGILANKTYQAEFIYDNLAIATNVIHAAHRAGVRKLLNLGSSCIYPKLAPQPIKEEHLLTGPLEPTNEPYAVAKIAAIKLCRYYNAQYGTNFISVMPTNLYGPHDNFDLESSHVLPALIRKFHLARLLAEGDTDAVHRDLEVFGNPPAEEEEDVASHLARFGIAPDAVTIWGSGEPYREFLYTEDLARACVFLMERFDYREVGELINVGVGRDITIRDLTLLIKDVVGFEGDLKHDRTKPDGTPRKLLDVSRLLALNWHARTKLTSGIEKTYDWYCSQSLT